MRMSKAAFIGFFILNFVLAFGQNDYSKYVNPFVGTKNMGHTYPGATVPFGMVQLSPETNMQLMFVDGQYNSEAYRYCAGYQYEDSTIFGFAHTHFSGTGHSDLGDFLIMPTSGELILEPGTADGKTLGFHSKFSHDSESAGPGYYAVKLDDFGIKAELTASPRVGFHQYSFQDQDKARIILDLIYNIYNYDDKNVWTFIRVENDTLVTGYRQTHGWARTRTVYFAMAFSEPIQDYGFKRYEKQAYNGFYRKFKEEENFPEMAGKNIRAWFEFPPKANNVVKIKFALSAVSSRGAVKNLKTEIPHWDFEKQRAKAKKEWNKELAKIEVETMEPEDLTTFYTAFYHTMLSPTIYEDVDGSYRGLDQNIHISDDFTNYTTFSLWDTYRALHPLFNIVQTKRNADMAKSMLAHYDQSVHKMLPVWSHYANENWCMIGYHSVSALADAILKGNTGIDPKVALTAAVNTSNCRYFDGLDHYIDFGYVAEDQSSSSVSKTLEYAYDDWCIAQLAIFAGEDSIAEIYLKRAQNFKNTYEPKSSYMRPKLANGKWKASFNPYDTHGQGFIEGNAWNYGLYVPHDVDGMVALMGGKDVFAVHLDSIFDIGLDEKYISKNEDITRDGIMGSYVHGNEPGHHIPYLYNWTNAPWKTQKRVRTILNTMYGDGVDGLCGNDDAGQMSAWYVLSAMGFYPVCPGSDEYALGSPILKSATIKLENGKTLKIVCQNQSPKNIYVKKVLVNGKAIDRNYLKHNEIMEGGEIEFVMTNKVPGN
jgi:predicted alpha-1,2-mannosidase